MSVAGSESKRRPVQGLPPAVLSFDPANLISRIFTNAQLSRLAEILELDSSVVLTEMQSPEARRHLARAEVLIAGWGAPAIPVASAPRLQAVIYAGGVAATCLEDAPAHGARGVVAANARPANSVPVAEYALATILLANKNARTAEREFRRSQRHPAPSPTTGNLDRTVGIVGASTTGRLLIDLLRPFDLRITVYDPLLSAEEAERLGVQTGSLQEVAAQSDVLSLHQPLTAETAGQIGADILALMPDGATLINTARGAVLDEAALVAELRTGRIEAVLDVTDPEPPRADSPLWHLPNVTLTPHIAGSMGTELLRLGAAVVAEVEHFVAGAPFDSPEELR